MDVRAALGIMLVSFPLLAQPTCPATPAWTPCDLVFELAANENPAQVELRAEFRSPRHKTFLMPAFHDAARRMVIRFTPTEPGEWDYRLTSSVARWDGQTGQFSATPSEAPGFVRPRNLHHWATENGKQHLWMSTAVEAADRAEFDRLLVARASEKFTHIRLAIAPGADLREIDERVRRINALGLVADVVLAGIPEDWQERERYLRTMVARYAAFNITWSGPAFDQVKNGRALMKEAGGLLKKLDPYNHPRTALAAATSAALVGDGWLNFTTYGSADEQLGAVEHQIYQVPAINTAIHDHRDLWRATMSGQYPAGGSGQHMSAWFDFMAGNRYWELEPYFDVDGGRAVALEGVEYVVYVEKPGPVEVAVEKHGYDVAWINPASGERVPRKEFKGERFTGEPPDRTHDWVLHISREGRKQGMLHSYKFESREVPLIQEVEQTPQKAPFEIAEPAGAELSLSKATRFAAKIKRETRATRSLMYLWTAEVVADGEGYRVLGTGREGTLQIPAGVAKSLPAVLSVRVGALNANGKAYLVDRVYKLVP